MSIDLSAVFGKYAGQRLLHPRRMTCDYDTVLHGLRQDATNNGLELNVHWPDMPSKEPATGNTLNVYLDKERRIQNNFKIS